MRYGDLTYLEIRQKVEAGWLAVVPTGCTEQQGPHLPVDFDTWFAEALMLAAVNRAARRGVNALVLPALPFGPTPEHRSFGSGFIDIPQAVHEALLASVLNSLAAQGFRRIVVWRGCGGHRLGGVVEAFNTKGEARAFLPTETFYESWCRIGDPEVLGRHADSFTTSISLYLRPKSVRRELIANPHSKPVDWDDPDLDFADSSDTGVIGDPTHSSVALGERLWEDVVAKAAQMLVEVAAT